MIGTMTPTFRKALVKADDLRIQLGLSMFQPVNIFDICAKLDIDVRFVNVSMEGMYAKHEIRGNPTILLSCLRPLPRRAFTCAHELGHHVFGHGSKLDPLAERPEQPSEYNRDEILVDCFAGALLMPGAGIEAAFSKRKLNYSNVSAYDVYKISSDFGVGYQTLVAHCRATKLFSEFDALRLLRMTPKKIFTALFGASMPNTHFKIMDGCSRSSVIDLEVSNIIVLPEDVQVEGSHIKLLQKFEFGNAFLAERPGIVRASALGRGWGAFIRIQNFQYVGLAENRHLETLNDEV